MSLKLRLGIELLPPSTELRSNNVSGFWIQDKIRSAKISEQPATLLGSPGWSNKCFRGVLTEARGLNSNKRMVYLHKKISPSVLELL
jgi:hypothetical protein